MSSFFFVGRIGKSEAFIVRALANLLCLIDELRVNFIMHLEKSRSPKEMLFGGGGGSHILSTSQQKISPDLSE